MRRCFDRQCAGRVLGVSPGKAGSGCVVMIPSSLVGRSSKVQLERAA